MHESKSITTSSTPQPPVPSTAILYWLMVEYSAFLWYKHAVSLCFPTPKCQPARNNGIFLFTTQQVLKTKTKLKKEPFTQMTRFAMYLLKCSPQSILLWVMIISTSKLPCALAATNRNSTCKAEDVPIDVLFVLDVSASVEPNYFNDAKNFTAKFMVELGKVWRDGWNII